MKQTAKWLVGLSLGLLLSYYGIAETQQMDSSTSAAISSRPFPMNIRPCNSWLFSNEANGYVCGFSPGYFETYSASDVDRMISDLQRKIDDLERRVQQLEGK